MCQSWSRPTTRALATTCSHACWGALGRQTVPAIEVIVVVDHNPELLAARPQRVPVGDRDRQNRHARGLAGARNTRSRRYASGLDCRLRRRRRASRGRLARAAADCFADSGGSGRRVDSSTGTNGMPRWLPTSSTWVFGCSYTGLPSNSRPCATRSEPTWRCKEEVLKQSAVFARGEGRTPAGDSIARGGAGAGQRPRRH